MADPNFPWIDPAKPFRGVQHVHDCARGIHLMVVTDCQPWAGKVPARVVLVSMTLKCKCLATHGPASILQLCCN
jgi:hypothetical protein